MLVEIKTYEAIPKISQKDIIKAYEVAKKYNCKVELHYNDCGYEYILEIKPDDKKKVS